MSMLLGMRGPGRDSEGQPVRESIIQQPGSFYNGNPSSSIWGNNPPTPPNWRDSSPANGVFPSSTSTSVSVSSSSSVCGSSMEHQSHWQQVVFNATGELKTEIDKPKDKDVPTTRRAAEFMVRQDRPEQIFGAARPSIFSTPISPFSFGFPPQSSSINIPKLNDGLDASQIASNHRVSHESLFEGGGGYVFEASSGAHNALKNQNNSSTRISPVVEFSDQGSTASYSMENLMKDWESRLHLQRGVPNNLATPANLHHTFKLTEEDKPVSLETKLPSAACGKAVKNSRPSTDNEKLCTAEPTAHVKADDVPIDVGGSQALPGQKDGKGVFVFGASGTNVRAGPSQQKFLNPSGAGGMSKSRFGKLKKHPTFTKGKGAGIGGATGVGQAAQEVSRDGSPLSSVGADFKDTSPYDDECSHWSEHDIGATHESQSTSHRSKPKVTLGLGLDRSSMHSAGHFNRTYSIGSDDNHSFYSLNASVFMSSNKDNQQEEQLHTVSQRLNGWHPFLQQSDQNFTGGGSQTTEAIPNLTNLKTTCRPGVADGFVEREATDDPLSDESIANVIAEMAKCGSPLGKQERPGSSLETCTQEGNTQCPNEASADGINSSEIMSAESKSYSEFSVEELRQRIAKLGGADPVRHGQKEDQDATGGQNNATYPFVFRASRPSKASTHTVNGDSNFGPDQFVPTFSSVNRKGENVNAAELHNRDKNSNFENLQGPGAGSATFFNPPTTPMSFEVGSNEKGSYSAQTPLFSFSNTSLAGASVSGSHPNLTSFNAMQQASFVKPHSEAPVGEFAGPPSPESSASDSSPPRSEQWSTGDGSSFGERRHFEFRGISKGVHGGASIGKKKARVSSTTRRLGRRPTNKQKKGAQGGSYATPAKEGAGSPMDFSPCVGEAVPHSKLGLSDADVEQVWDGWVPSAESQGVEEVRAAAAKLSLNKEQEEDQARHQEFRFTGDPTGWFEFPCQRNPKWKRAAREEGQSASNVVGNLWANNKNGKEAEYPFITTSNADASSQHGFIFGSDNVRSSLSSPMPLKHFSLSQVEVTRESGKYPDFHGEAAPNSVTGGPNAQGSTVFSRVSELSVSANQGPFHGSSVKGSDAYGVFQQSDSGTPSSPSAMKSAAAEQVCERWRLRGNKAYADGDFPKAEECYSRGASSVSPNETSQSCIRASMLCYSNRAATRMAVGRMREALADCMRAMVVDPNFLRVRTRAASCYLALGDSEAAANMFRECLKHAKEGTKPDAKIAAEAMEGIKKAQQVDDYSVRAFELLQKENSTDSTAALRLLNEALSISTYSEFLLEMKAQVLFSLRRYEEVVQLCEQSLISAERNHGTAVIDQQDAISNEASSSIENALLKLWRWRMIGKSLFHLGKLEESLDLLLKHEEGLSTLRPEKAASIESLSPLVSTISDLLRHKAAGNEAFQAGKHSEAVEHYTAALACNGESRPYNAVCFCNRAAASQALGHIADAIADCSRAIALDPSYPKAISRRATLHEMVRDYGQACNDLQRLVTLLEGYQSHGKNNQSTRVGAQNLNMQDLKQARERLVKAEDDMKKGYPINHYLILGVDSSCSANEIKKAYRKAALKHHPDKAGQFLVRGENGDDGNLWKEVGEEVRRDAERLFKLIGEGYAILSDPTKRLRYDTDEEHRKLRAKSGSSSVSSTSEGYRSQYEKTSRRQRERWDAWNGYTQYQRWQSGPDAAQPDTYARRSTYAANGSKTGGTASRANDYLWDDI